MFYLTLILNVKIDRIHLQVDLKDNSQSDSFSGRLFLALRKNN